MHRQRSGIISKEELEKMPSIKKKSVNAKSNFRQKCFSLEVGQAYFISRKDWEKAGYAKSTKPSNILVGSSKRFRSETKENGWGIIRRR